MGCQTVPHLGSSVQGDTWRFDLLPMSWPWSTTEVPTSQHLLLIYFTTGVHQVGEMDRGLLMWPLLSVRGCGHLGMWLLHDCGSKVESKFCMIITGWARVRMTQWVSPETSTCSFSTFCMWDTGIGKTHMKILFKFYSSLWLCPIFLPNRKFPFLDLITLSISSVYI